MPLNALGATSTTPVHTWPSLGHRLKIVRLNTLLWAFLSRRASIPRARATPPRLSPGAGTVQPYSCNTRAAVACASEHTRRPICQAPAACMGGGQRSWCWRRASPPTTEPSGPVIPCDQVGPPCTPPGPWAWALDLDLDRLTAFSRSQLPTGQQPRRGGGRGATAPQHGRYVHPHHY
jgi:hypothetical protein